VLMTMGVYHMLNAVHRLMERTLRVIVQVDGRYIDVTDRCVSADDRHGWACCYRLNANGAKYIDPASRTAAMEILTGSVIFSANWSQAC
jgi:hypothetical protein